MLYNPDVPIENLVNPYMEMSPMERAIRGFVRCDKSKNAITSVYTCDSIEDILIASLYHLVELKTPIKICANCGKYSVNDKNIFVLVARGTLIKMEIEKYMKEQEYKISKM